MNRRNEIEIGKEYYVNDIKCKAVAYYEEKKVLVLKEEDGNIIFISDGFTVKDKNIICVRTYSYMVTDKEFFNCINTNLKTFKGIPTQKDMVNILRSRYYKIPSVLLEAVVSWYCNINTDR